MAFMTTFIQIHNQSRHVYYHIAFQFCVYLQVCVNSINHFVCKLHCIVFKIRTCKFVFFSRFLFMHLYKFQEVYKVVVTQCKDYKFLCLCIFTSLQDCFKFLYLFMYVYKLHYIVEFFHYYLLTLIEIEWSCLLPFVFIGVGVGWLWQPNYNNDNEMGARWLWQQQWWNGNKWTIVMIMECWLQ